MNTTYELMLLVEPKETEDASKTAVSQVVKSIKTHLTGVEIKEDYWGERELAYKIGKNTKALYTVLNFKCSPEIAKNLPKILNINDKIIRYLLTKLED